MSEGKCFKYEWNSLKKNQGHCIILLLQHNYFEFGLNTWMSRLIQDHFICWKKHDHLSLNITLTVPAMSWAKKVNKSVINMNIFLQSGMLSPQVAFYVIGEIMSTFFSMSRDWKPSNWGKVEQSEIAEKLTRMPSTNNCRRRSRWNSLTLKWL